MIDDILDILTQTDEIRTFRRQITRLKFMQSILHFYVGFGSTSLSLYLIIVKQYVCIVLQSLDSAKEKIYDINPIRNAFRNATDIYTV